MNRNDTSDEPEFVSGETYQVAYNPRWRLGEDFDTILACPACGCVLWKYQDRTGTGKLPKDQMKLKCHACGQWFIANRREITKVLGQ